jgi:hypothetical protein
MKKRIFIAALAVALGASVAYARTPHSGSAKAEVRSAAVSQSAVPVPQRPVTLATVRIPRAVTADDRPLAPGTYQVWLIGNPLQPAAGETAGAEQWVQFRQHGTVKGKAVASVVPRTEIRQVAAGDWIPAPGHARVDVLKGNDYLRVWINRRGTNYLIHLPTATS